jgi:hypothetical protein
MFEALHSIPSTVKKTKQKATIQSPLFQTGKASENSQF